MSSKLLSFIGTTSYFEAYYLYNGHKTNKPCQFIQEGLVEFFCNDWNNKDQIIIFLTKEACQKNWKGKDEFPEANFSQGLKKRLERKEIKAQITPMSIPECANQNDFLKIFEIITQNIKSEDTIFLDITHAFRSIPMLAFVSLNYARVLKDVEIEKILYGCMESLGNPKEVKKMPVENRKIPIFDLTGFANLFEWTMGIERFLETGNARKLEKLAEKELNPRLRQSEGEEGVKYGKLIRLLRAFEGKISTCRGPEIKGTVEEITTALNQTKNDTIEIPPLDLLIEKVKSRFASINTENQINCGLDSVSWCIEHGLIQQGYTILRETIINFILKETPEYSDLRNQKYRKKAEENLIKENKKISPDIFNLWRELIDFRNDINHAGWRESEKKYTKFEKKLKNFNKRARKLFYKK